MDGTYRTELENDGANLVVTFDAAEMLRLKVSVPWKQIVETIAPEVRARFSKGAVVIHFVGEDDGMRFALASLVEDWVDRFDPANDASVRERDRLLAVLRDCAGRIEGTLGPA
jgi:hypothetical protein